MDLLGSRVVITGASAGIGREIAREFARRGAQVLGVARSADKLTAMAEETGGEWIAADLSNDAEVDSIIGRCIDRLGGIDILVNNAGVETDTAFTEVPRDDIRRLNRLNLETVMLLTRDVLPHMLERGSGHIVQLSSVAGAIPFPGLAAYSGTKAGVTNFTETLRLELRGRGVGLTVVAPGPVQTEMWDRLENDTTPFPAPALKRFRQLGFLPKVDPAKLASGIADAVEDDKRFVRDPARYAMYHALNNAPRRLVEVALTGVRLPLRWNDELAASTIDITTDAPRAQCSLPHKVQPKNNRTEENRRWSTNGS